MSESISILAKVFFVAFITVVMLYGVYILHPPFSYACDQGDEQHETCDIGHDCEDHENGLGHDCGEYKNGKRYGYHCGYYENSAPVITLIGDATTTIAVGTTFVDPGATAYDAEDGDITDKIVVGGDVVSTTTPGTYVITYNVTDSQGLAAPEATRTVIVEAVPDNNEGGGSGGGGNGGGGGGGGGQTSGTTYAPANGPIIQPPVTLIQTSSPAVVSAPVVSGECNYLLEYLRYGRSNNPLEVIKLQGFLRNYEGFSNLQITGNFDEATLNAVNIFQERYSQDVLVPWGLESYTGYVYITTKKKINEIYCQRPFPLTLDQGREIAAYRDRSRITASAETSPGPESAPLEEVGILPPGADEISGEIMVESATTATTAPLSFSQFNIAALKTINTQPASPFFTLPANWKTILGIILAVILAIFAFTVIYFRQKRKEKADLSESPLPGEMITTEEYLMAEPVPEESFSDDYIFHL
jgi:hypothetical protein